MEFTKVRSDVDGGIVMDVAKGHFATNHSHVNYYVDLTRIKTYHKMAKNAAELLSARFNDVPVDTILCMEGTNMAGAFLAWELAQPGYMGMNSGEDICVLTPEMNTSNQLIFRENTLPAVGQKNILLMLSSVSTGKTVNRTLDCLGYYGARLTGICALFSAAGEPIHGLTVHSVFTDNDIDGYDTFLPGECAMCARGEKIDAIVNNYGYSKLRET